MESAGQNQVDQIRQDLACPGCQYNLRGLSGANVTCPECGQMINIAQLVARKWTGRWYHAPGFNRLVFPLAASLLLGIPAGVCSAFPGLQMVGGILFLLSLAAWLALMIMLGVKEGGEGIALSLLGHLVYLGYLAGILAALGGLLGTFASLMSGQQADIPATVIALVVGLSAVGVIVLAHFGERFIAKRCIARYLQRAPIS